MLEQQVIDADNKKKQKRLDNYDVLRSISCISVIILHVATAYIREDFRDVVSYNSFAWGAFYRVMTNLAVPCFVMLSGAFLLNDKNSDYKYFYGKMKRKIIVPTIAFSVIYVVIQYIEIGIAHKLESGGEAAEGGDYLQPLVNLLKGEPNQTMWFMFMMIGLYVFTPVIIRIKESICSKSYRWLGVALFLYGILVSHTCTLSWIMWYTQWMGYFVLGNVLFEIIGEWNDKESVKKVLGIITIIISYCICLLYWYVGTYGSDTVEIPGSFSLVITAGALLQFVGFSLLRNMLSAGRFTKLISNKSMAIYLLHPMFCELFTQFFGRIVKWFPSGVFIPLYAILIGLACCLLSLISKLFMKCYKVSN